MQYKVTRGPVLLPTFKCKAEMEKLSARVNIFEWYILKRIHE